MGLSDAFDRAASLVGDREPGVAVAVLRDGEVIHRRAYGMADLEWELPLEPDCSFRIASLTKQFTAAAVLRLAEQGRLALEDPLQRHLPAFDPRGRIVTLEHLLNHTSGLRNHDKTEPLREARPNIPVAEVIGRVIGAPFEFEPGARYRYCNTGYLLLGAVIEAASGAPYGTFLQREFFAPLGMDRTGLFARNVVVPKRARGHVRGRRGFYNALGDAENWSYAAGGLSSTLDDLATWDRALRYGRVMQPQSFARMIAPTMTAEGPYPYGLGWGVGEYLGCRLHHHTGGISGYACQMTRLTDEPLTTIVLSNLDAFPFNRVTRGLLRAAKGLPAPAPVGRPTTTADIAACVGRYGNEDGAVFAAVDEDRIVFATVPEQPDLRSYLTLGEGRFATPLDPEEAYRFSDLQDGRYQTLEYASPLWPAQRFSRLAEGSGGEV
ncbi:serine hydrolase [uncultured Phenylobacterium sp.]|uniref:serine hydrolase domain-containing protein n=1 Tax=uncultured Phenylobacterium sp. TaxID=349273 RepID=UPI0025E2A724|nr:serine hydrolase domain-containing protein [uncultured Phenylobacterium sp.]